MFTWRASQNRHVGLRSGISQGVERAVWPVTHGGMETTGNGGKRTNRFYLHKWLAYCTPSFLFRPLRLWGYNLSHITSFDRSVKEIHEIASGVPAADVTTNRLCLTSPNRYFCWANRTSERWTFSLSYFKWENAVGTLSCPPLRRPPSLRRGDSRDKLFSWWCHDFLISLLFCVCPALGHFSYILPEHNSIYKCIPTKPHTRRINCSR